ncbi:MAG TPA: substrate-binding domain-containing protein [Candidatus Omnitrophota bacterium]|nr:substrate-binding domain-containing protein [Candidatus Omnitrophota bacterium]HPS36690.1 substrate-binding domain-containing protein [Candidatus Omnitrophota bacterium]
MREDFFSKSRYTFGVLTTVAKDIFHSRYHGELLSGIFQRAGSLGHQLKIFTPPDEPCASLTTLLREHDLDGLFILTWRWIRPDISKLVETQFQDRVLVFNDPAPGLRVNLLYTDVDAGMAQAVRHLVRKGCRKIGLLHGPSAVPFLVAGKKVMVPFTDTGLKKKGFLEALRSRGVPVRGAWIRATAANSEAEGYRVMRRWLREKRLPEALVCGNDDLAFGAFAALRESGRNAPNDLAIVGFDDSEHKKIFPPPLTSVRQPLFEMGRDAVDILVRQIEASVSKPVCRKYLPKLVVRKTA